MQEAVVREAAEPVEVVAAVAKLRAPREGRRGAEAAAELAREVVARGVAESPEAEPTVACSRAASWRRA